MKKALSFIMIAVALAGCTTTDETTSTGVTTEHLTTAEIRSLLNGKKVSYDAGGQSKFAGDGTYTFRGRGRTSTGRYFFQNNRVCYDFGGGSQRCDSYIKIGNAYYLVNNQGRRFRARIQG